MAIITLTTDFGLKDYFVSAVKAKIYTELPDAKIVDVSHDIQPYSVIEAAYVLGNTFRYFPKGTIHIIGVNSECSPLQKHIVVELEGHFFVCADNTIMSIINSENRPIKIHEINSIKTAFPTLNVFTKIACELANGKPITEFGNALQELKPASQIQPEIIGEDTLIGKVIYIDRYKNLVTNITRDLFNEVGKGREFTIKFRNYQLNKVYEQYNDFVDYNIGNQSMFIAKRFSIFNSANRLEIAIYKGDNSSGASNLLGISYGDTIRVEFKNTKKT